MLSQKVLPGQAYETNIEQVAKQKLPHFRNRIQLFVYMFNDKIPISGVYCVPLFYIWNAGQSKP